MKKKQCETMKFLKRFEKEKLIIFDFKYGWLWLLRQEK